MGFFKQEQNPSRHSEAFLKRNATKISLTTLQMQIKVFFLLSALVFFGLVWPSCTPFKSSPFTSKVTQTSSHFCRHPGIAVGFSSVPLLPSTPLTVDTHTGTDSLSSELPVLNSADPRGDGTVLRKMSVLYV